MATILPTFQDRSNSDCMFQIPRASSIKRGSQLSGSAGMDRAALSASVELWAEKASAMLEILAESLLCSVLHSPSALLAAEGPAAPDSAAPDSAAPPCRFHYRASHPLWLRIGSAVLSLSLSLEDSWTESASCAFCPLL